MSSNSENYIDKVNNEYKDIRKTFSEHKTELMPLKEARKNKFNINFKEAEIKVPGFIGIKKFMNFPLKELRKYIDWTFFFTSWDMGMVYPKILDDPKYGTEAKKLLADANKMLDLFESQNIISANGVLGIFPANSTGDDIEVYHNGKTTTFNMLRQQQILKSNRFKCLSDYIAPKESGIKDYIGGFIVTAGIGAKEYSEKLKKNGDEYGAAMAKILCDRLAEAFSEVLHLQTRKSYFGYAPEENLPLSDLLKGAYRGIRPAFGYPCLNNHAEKTKLFDMLYAEGNIGVNLTESYMMDPVSSTCGLYFANEEAKYFTINKIGRDQLEDYAKRCNTDTTELEKLFNTLL